LSYVKIAASSTCPCFKINSSQGEQLLVSAAFVIGVKRQQAGSIVLLSPYV
jgi:hypothetical protein